MLDRPAAEALRKFCAKGMYLKEEAPTASINIMCPP